MAKKVQLSYKDIEKNLSVFKDRHVAANEIGYQILKAFGKGDREIERMKEGKGVVSTFDGLLVKNEFCYKATTTLCLAGVLEELKGDAQVLRANPKIIAVSDGKTIRAYDLRKKDSFEQQVARLYCDFEFFYPLAGVERIEYVEESEADIKAAEKLAKLHDEIRAYNEFTSDSDLHDLNTFIARLLFCFFAEDTGIFPSNSFTRAIKQFTHDATNVKDVLEQLFRFMGGKPIRMGMMQTYCNNNFAYVGGGLFERETYIPMLSNKARQIIIDSGELDWENINPDIFGSMIQAVVNPDVRANQGMHYTSVPNIMKVINPLFLDELRSEYTALSEEQDKIKKQKDVGMLSQSQYLSQCKPIEKKCRALLLRMSKMKFFDPACGSGNFLIITYKMLRLLEMDILSLIGKCNPQGSLQFIDGSVISIQQFYGIELLDFPHESAMLSLWLAEHQMNKKMREDFGVNTKALPLKEITQIKCGNACRLDWNVVCPHAKDDEVYVFGNPPYLGSKLQSAEQKADIAHVFGKIKNSKILDYIANWFYLGAKFVKGTKSKYAFVSTNSICQGEQVAVLWPEIFKSNLCIDYAYTSFKWTNNAKHNAAVICVIIGVSTKTSKHHSLYEGEKVTQCLYISPYLTKDTETVIYKETTKPKDYPKLCFGCMPYDGGNLLFDKEEYDSFIREYPECTKYTRRIFGSEEFINDKFRYCLWIDDEELEEALCNPVIKQRVEATRQSRLESKDGAELANRAHQFREHPDLCASKIIVPSTSSERRLYIPIGYLEASDVVTNSAFAIYDAPIHLFGIITSRIHMDWVRSVGGRLKSDYRYSAGLCYNPFPFPKLTSQKKQEIEDAATDILLTREPYLTIGKTLADLYDPDTMPADLKAAHERLDDIVESCYPGYPFANDEARLECLFKMYEKMTKK
ncbi:MAG: class I SAM-dependent DNA methyltransferase [Prevotellaceae bacterium]|nr:class I SAM-dependent DNA methyltransferase [Candidatus Minthosoma equi]